jgi:hypothetical protein
VSDRRLFSMGTPEKPARTRNIENLPWLIGGVLFVVLLLAVVFYFHRDTSLSRELAHKAARLEVVSRMQLGLASASEAEKSAVLAITDETSKTYADQSRAASAAIERDREALGALIEDGGTSHEKELLDQFSKAFLSLQRVDKEVLDLAVKNTNLKAWSLLFGAAASTLAEMDTALAQMIAQTSGAPAAIQVMPMAFGARISALRLQTMMAPHIAEESDAKMDEMEGAMAKADAEIKNDLDGLTAFFARRAGGDSVETAKTQFSRYEAIKTKILSLSRENTNVRSLELSLNQKRKALAVCLEALGTLREAVLEEPIAGAPTGRPNDPRNVR